MFNGAGFAKRGLTLATICASVFLMACSQLTPPAKNESDNAAILAPTSVGQQLDSATTDDVVTGIEEAKLILPFILNNLQSRMDSSQDLNALWSSLEVYTENDPACDPAAHICLNIDDIKAKTAKADLVRSIGIQLASEVLNKAEVTEEKRADIQKELQEKLAQDPKNVLFPRVEVLYLNSQATTGVLRNAIVRVADSIVDEATINWVETCGDLEGLEKMGAKLGDAEAEKSQMLASLPPEIESVEASVKRITSNLKAYCETQSAGPAGTSSLVHNAGSLTQELQEAIKGLDRIYPSAKKARDLLRSFRL